MQQRKPGSLPVSYNEHNYSVHFVLLVQHLIYVMCHLGCHNCTVRAHVYLGLPKTFGGLGQNLTKLIETSYFSFAVI